MQDFDNEIQIFEAELQNIYNICANGTQEECDCVYQKLDSIYEWLNSIYDVYKIRHDWHNEENMKSDDYKNACERSRMFSRKTATEINRTSLMLCLSLFIETIIICEIAIQS